MPVRQATRRYADLGSFLAEYPTTLKVGALLLPAGLLDDDPAPEMKIDLVLPLLGRVGPIDGQVVARLPDGGVALRVAEIPPAVQAAVGQMLDIAEDVKKWLLQSGQLVGAGAAPTVQAPPPPVVRPEVIEQLQARIRELEGRLGATPPGAPAEAGGAEVSRGVPEARPRGLPVPDMTGVAPVLSGPLADRSLRDAFIGLAVEKLTGLLTVKRPDGRTRWGFWSKGGPVGWRTEPVEEQEVLGMLLYKGGTITEQQLQESLVVMERTGSRQGEALIEMGLCTFPQLVILLQKQVDFVFQRVLREREGTWTFHVLDDLPERFLTPPLRVASILYRALLKHAKEMPAQDLATSLRPWLDHYVVLSPGVERTFEEMKLTSDEQQFVGIIQKTNYRLREIFSVSSLSRSQTAAAVWSMQDLNLLEFRPESDGIRERERFERDLAVRRAASRAKTLFERLDVHWICTTAEVEVGYKKLKEEWSLTRLARVGEAHRAAFEEINAAMDDAYKGLSTDAKRREYRATIIERMKIEQSAEMLSKQGEMAIMKAASRDALNCFSKALELVPGNAEYREGFARAQAIPR